MTNEDVIEEIMKFMPPQDPEFMKLHEALELAIEAVEKQIPMEPGEIDRMSYCTVCNTKTTKRILMGWEKCCPDCGQRIDWSRKE